MNREKVTDPRKVPSPKSEEEDSAFWETHETTKEFWNEVEPPPEEELPPSSKTISLRVDPEMLQRLKDLAELRGKRYQTLLKEFVSAQLDIEEAFAAAVTAKGDVSLEDLVADWASAGPATPSRIGALAAAAAATGGLPAVAAMLSAPQIVGGTGVAHWGETTMPSAFGMFQEMGFAQATPGAPMQPMQWVPSVRAEVHGNVQQFVESGGAEGIKGFEFPQGGR